MSQTGEPNTTDIEQPVVAVIKLKASAADVHELLAEGIEVLAAESRELSGFLAAQILVSVDNTTMVILTEWSDHHAWGQSRYDVRVGNMIEHCYVKSATIEFEIYTRPASFVGTSTSDQHDRNIVERKTT